LGFRSKELPFSGIFSIFRQIALYIGSAISRLNYTARGVKKREK